MTTPTHQQKGHTWGSAKGTQDVQKPSDVGTVDLLLQSVGLGPLAERSVHAVGGPSPGSGHGGSGEGDDLNHCRSDAAGPPAWQREPMVD